MANAAQSADLQDDLTLRLWEGDDSAKGDLLAAWGGRIISAIRRGYPNMSKEDIEDVVSEAIMRFWEYRGKYDPARAKIGTLLYRIATRVASERISGQLLWQKQQIREMGVDAEFFKDIEALPGCSDEPPDDLGLKQTPIQKALATCFSTLSELQQDILRAFGDSGAYELDATVLGVELGHKHKDGVPIPGGTIRTNKSRAWDSLELCMKKKGFDLSALGYTNG